MLKMASNSQVSDNVCLSQLNILEFFIVFILFKNILCNDIKKLVKICNLCSKIKILSPKWLFPAIRVFGPYYSNIRIIFGPKNLTEYRIEYHYSVPNYSNIRIIRTIRSNTVLVGLCDLPTTPTAICISIEFQDNHQIIATYHRTEILPTMRLCQVIIP